MRTNWLESVYSDGSVQFVQSAFPKKGEAVRVALRLFADVPVQEIFLRTRINGGEERISMTREEEKNGLVYYRASVVCKEDTLHYQFYIVTEDTIYYYNQAGIFDCMPDEAYDFRIVYGYRQPEWVKHAVFYQIFPERFCNGDPEISVKDGEYQFDGHDTIQVKDWNAIPEEFHKTKCLDFYGGDLIGVRQKIPYLKELGVTALYLNPIFYAATIHKYDCLDYFKVDPHFGGDQALIDLVEELHKNDMRIILDVSINHTGSAHKWFNKEGIFFDKSIGAYNNPGTLERDYYFFGENNSYKAWWNVETLPTLNYTSEALREILYRGEDSLVKHWLKSPFHIDGWRFDVADVMARNDEHQLHHEVWPELVDSIKNTKSDAYVVAEEWGDCPEFLQGNEWDTPMNYYGCARPVREYVGEHDLFLGREESVRKTKPNQSAKALGRRIRQHFGKIPFQLQQVQFNLLDSHDASRLHNNPDISWEAVKVAITLLFTLPGAPSIYYGDEAGIEGRMNTNEGFRYPMPWNKKYKEDAPYKTYQTLARMKQTKEAFVEGGFKILLEQGKVFAFARFTDKQLYYIVTSMEEGNQEISLSYDIFGLSRVDGLEEIFGEQISYQDNDGNIILQMPGKTAYVFAVC